MIGHWWLQVALLAALVFMWILLSAKKGRSKGQPGSVAQKGRNSGERFL